jgi:hypothetical protein
LLTGIIRRKIMKKPILFLAGVLLFTSAVIPVFAATSSENAAESEQTEVATSAPVVVSPTPEPTQEYVLPYPGVLPDNPLYFLKTLRDRIMEWLIVDPLRKIDFYVLQSDKNLNAGIMLDLANKKTLVSGAVTQSVAYMEKAVSLASATKNSGGEVPAGTIEHITRSLTKHEEVLTDLNEVSLITKVKSYEESLGKLK